MPWFLRASLNCNLVCRSLLSGICAYLCYTCKISWIAKVFRCQKNFFVRTTSFPLVTFAMTMYVQGSLSQLATSTRFEIFELWRSLLPECRILFRFSDVSIYGRCQRVLKVSLEPPGLDGRPVHSPIILSIYTWRFEATKWSEIRSEFVRIHKWLTFWHSPDCAVLSSTSI